MTVMDDLTKEQRHRAMSHIKATDTKIEVLLRKHLWKKGIRYRKNYALLPGKPDIVISKYRIAIFCDSELNNCTPSAGQLSDSGERTSYKIQKNVFRQ